MSGKTCAWFSRPWQATHIQHNAGSSHRVSAVAAAHCCSLCACVHSYMFP